MEGNVFATANWTSAEVEHTSSMLKSFTVINIFVWAEIFHNNTFRYLVGSHNLSEKMLFYFLKFEIEGLLFSLTVTRFFEVI